MTNHPNRKIRGERSDRTLVLTAYGHRYLADGWTPFQALFQFHCPPHVETGYEGDSVFDYADDERRKGAGGLATHGCEDVTAVGQGERVIWHRPADFRPTPVSGRSYPDALWRVRRA